MADQFMGLLTMIVDGVNDVLWGYVLMYALVGVSIFFTAVSPVRSSFVSDGGYGKSSASYIKHIRRIVTDGRFRPSKRGPSRSPRVGLGNVAGVATAIMAGRRALFSGCG